MERVPASSFSLRFVALIVCWYLFTLCSNMSGKAFVKRTLDAVSPTTVSLGCAAAVYIGQEFLRRKTDDHRINWELHKWALVVGFIQFLATALTYASFALSSISWTYCFRTLEPLISAALQYVAFREVLTTKEISALSALAMGIVITVNATGGGQVYSAWVGGLAATATAIYSTRSVAGSRVMRQYQVSGRDLFLLASVYGFFFSIWSQISICILRCVSLNGLPWRVFGQLTFTGVFHCIYNLLSFQILEMLQPVSHGVCNTMKRVFMVVISAALSGNWLTPVQLLGMVIANIAAAVYSIEVRKRREARRSEIPVIRSDASDDALYNNATDKLANDPRRESKNQGESSKFMLWMLVVLMTGVMYLAFAFSALDSWRMSGEEKQPSWNAQEFFTNLFTAQRPLIS